MTIFDDEYWTKTLQALSALLTDKRLCGNKIDTLSWHSYPVSFQLWVVLLHYLHFDEGALEAETYSCNVEGLIHSTVRILFNIA